MNPPCTSRIGGGVQLYSLAKIVERIPDAATMIAAMRKPRFANPKRASKALLYLKPYHVADAPRMA
jgi:hypothetical protein